MRDDMSKVVTERPRQGHGNKSKKTTGQRIRRYDPDREYDEPTRLPIARHRQYGYARARVESYLQPLQPLQTAGRANTVLAERTKAGIRWQARISTDRGKLEVVAIVPPCDGPTTIAGLAKPEVLQLLRGGAGSDKSGQPRGTVTPAPARALVGTVG